jgi:phage gp29-like protein
VRLEVRDSDLKQLAATLTRDLIYPLYVLNGTSYQNQRRIPRLEFDVTEPEDMRDLAYPLRSLVSMGLKVPASWVRDKLQIPEPQGDEAVLQMVTEQVPGAQGEAMLKARSAHWAVLAAERQVQDKAELLTGRLSRAGEDAVAGWTNEVEQLLGEVKSLEEFRDRLLERYRDLPTDELATLMQRAFVAAELAGMADVGLPEGA